MAARRKRRAGTTRAPCALAALAVLLCLASLSAQFALQLSLPASETSATGGFPPAQAEEEEAYCGTGRNKVFVDVGALDGDTLDVHRRLRPDAYEYKCYAWECDRQNVGRLRKWLQTYGKGLDVDIIDKAAWIENTTLRFQTGASNAGMVVEGDAGGGQSVEVEAIDFAEWITGTLKKSDFVFVKIDIETAEFQVLPHLLETGAVEYIDEFQIEWHDWGNFRTQKRTERRKELEERLESYGFGNRYATFDMEMQGVDNVDFEKVPRYYDASTWPHPWVDLHYFRKAEGCRSPWDIPQTSNAS